MAKKSRDAIWFKSQFVDLCVLLTLAKWRLCDKEKKLYRSLNNILVSESTI